MVVRLQRKRNSSYCRTERVLRYGLRIWRWRQKQQEVLNNNCAQLHNIIWNKALGYLCRLMSFNARPLHILWTMDTSTESELFMLYMDSFSHTHTRRSGVGPSVGCQCQWMGISLWSLLDSYQEEWGGIGLGGGELTEWSLCWGQTSLLPLHFLWQRMKNAVVVHSKCRSHKTHVMHIRTRINTICTKTVKFSCFSNRPGETATWCVTFWCRLFTHTPKLKTTQHSSLSVSSPFLPFTCGESVCGTFSF